MHGFAEAVYLDVYEIRDIRNENMFVYIAIAYLFLPSFTYERFIHVGFLYACGLIGLNRLELETTKPKRKYTDVVR